MYWGIVSADGKFKGTTARSSSPAISGTAPRRRRRLTIHRVPLAVHLCRRKPGATHRSVHTDLRGRTGNFRFLERFLDEPLRFLLESRQSAQVLVLLLPLVSANQPAIVLLESETLGLLG